MWPGTIKNYAFTRPLPFYSSIVMAIHENRGMSKWQGSKIIVHSFKIEQTLNVLQTDCEVE